MSGVNVEAGGGGRRSLDSEINMIPMIDLLMVTISFLLITAVWSRMARLNVDANVPGPPSVAPLTPPTPAKQLHIEMGQDDKFVLVWKQGGAVLSRSEMPRRDVVSMEGAVKVVRFPDLAARVASEWTASGSHRDASDHTFDQAILHTDDATRFGAIVGVMDAVSQVHRPLGKGAMVPAFNLTLAN
jgi:biopolymer transport protein ExbD